MAAKFFGQFLLEKGLIDKDQLLSALEAQRASNPVLGEMAVSLGLLTPDQAEKINEHQRREDRRFGDIAQALGFLTEAQVDELLARQKAERKLFGEILLEQGALTRAQLDTELKLHQSGREDAMKALEIGIAGHPLEDLATAAINTYTKLFPRIVKASCPFSSLVTEASALTAYPVTAHVRITGDRSFTLAVACGMDAMRGVAAAFVGIRPEDCDDALARDALGEYLNVVMGYVVKEVLSGDARYRATPPDFGRPATNFFTSGRALLVTMTSELGPFVLIVEA